VPEPLDLNQVDEWAVKLVVHEGVKMNLNSHERVVASVQMRDLGIQATEIADRMRCSVKDVQAYWRRWSRVGTNLCTQENYSGSASS